MNLAYTPMRYPLNAKHAEGNPAAGGNLPTRRSLALSRQTLAHNQSARTARGLHCIPPGAKVLVPVSIEKGVWEYFSGKAEKRGVELSELVTEVLKRDIEINEALKQSAIGGSPTTGIHALDP